MKALAIMVSAGLLLASFEASAENPYDDIPVVFQGLWGSSLAECRNEDSTKTVRVGARTIEFYEAQALLDRGQLNHASDPPELFGLFKFTGELRFWENVQRLRMVGAELEIAHVNDNAAERVFEGVRAYVRCPAGSS